MSELARLLFLGVLFFDSTCTEWISFKWREFIAKLVAKRISRALPEELDLLAGNVLYLASDLLPDLHVKIRSTRFAYLKTAYRLWKTGGKRARLEVEPQLSLLVELSVHHQELLEASCAVLCGIIRVDDGLCHGFQFVSAQVTEELVDKVSRCLSEAERRSDSLLECVIGILPQAALPDRLDIASVDLKTWTEKGWKEIAQAHERSEPS